MAEDALARLLLDNPAQKGGYHKEAQATRHNSTCIGVLSDKCNQATNRYTSKMTSTAFETGIGTVAWTSPIRLLSNQNTITGNHVSGTDADSFGKALCK